MRCAPPPAAIEPALSRSVTWRVTHWMLRGGEPAPPIYLRTSTGRMYRVHTVRRSREGSQSRYTFGCNRIPPSEVPNGVSIVEWRWNRRPSRARNRRMVDG